MDILVCTLCCWETPYKRSMVAGVYTTLEYSMLIAAVSFLTSTFGTHLDSVISGLAYGAIVFYIAVVGSSIYLIWGLLQKNRNMFLPWFVSTSVTCVYQMAALTYLAYLFFQMELPLYSAVAIAIGMMLCMFTGLCIIFVKKHYRLMGLPNNEYVRPSENPLVGISSEYIRQTEQPLVITSQMKGMGHGIHA